MVCLVVWHKPRREYEENHSAKKIPTDPNSPPLIAAQVAFP